MGFVLPKDRKPNGEEIEHIIRIIKLEEEYEGDIDELLEAALKLGDISEKAILFFE